MSSQVEHRSGRNLLAKFWAMVCVLLSITSATIVYADSWILPTVTTTKSKNGLVRFIITPRDLSSQLDYFSDASDGKKSPGQRADGVKHAVGKLETKSNGVWKTVWTNALVNDVAPVEALVANNGKYVVTFDNWHSVGYGKAAIVVYGTGGKLINQLALSDFLPQDYIDALPHSVSSIWWRGSAAFRDNEKMLQIPVVVPDRSDLGDDKKTYVNFQLDLATGKVAPQDSAAWQRALIIGKRKHAEDVDRARQEDLAFRNPLLGPKENDELGWQNYLWEAAEREGEKGGAWRTFIRNPEAKDYAASVKWLRDSLSGKDDFDVRAIASYSQENLIKLLKEIIPSVPPGKLKGSTAYFAVTDKYWPEVVKAMKPTGAKLIQLDPTKPIPQRPERIKCRFDKNPPKSCWDL